MPHQYTVNEPIESRPIFEAGNAACKPQLLDNGLLRLAEAVECIGGLMGNRGERMLALKAALLVLEITRTHPQLFNQVPRWAEGRHLGPGLLRQVVNTRFGGYAGVEAVGKMIAADPQVHKYLTDSE